MKKANRFQAVIVGAGPAGLATSYELRRRKIGHIVLERGDSIAHAWRKLYDSLTLHTGKHMSSLPGMPFSSSTPLFPTRNQFLDYLGTYAKRFDLPIQTKSEVKSIARSKGVWNVQANGTNFLSENLVIATGIISNPHLPKFKGQENFQGQIIHSVEYRRPDMFKNARVLVVGTGNSGGEISSELARNGAKVTISVRSGAAILPRDILGIPVQYFSRVLVALPKNMQRRIMLLTAKISELKNGPPVLPKPLESLCPDVPLIGFHLKEAIQEGLICVKPNVERISQNSVCFQDGSEENCNFIILATGYRASLNCLANLIRLDSCGFASRVNRVMSADQPNLYFVGHNYDATGGLFNIARDARLVGGCIKA